MTPVDLYEIVITAIVVKPARLDDAGRSGGGGKYLILRRSPEKKRFPGRWTVPGGHLERGDYENGPKETKEYWYNVLEKALRREVKEEAGIEITNIEYVTSLATVHADGSPSLVISCMADYASGELMLQPGETDQYAWVTLEEAKKYDLIDGILDELVMADRKRKGARSEWQRA